MEPPTAGQTGSAVPAQAPEATSEAVSKAVTAAPALPSPAEPAPPALPVQSAPAAGAPRRAPGQPAPLNSTAIDGLNGPRDGIAGGPAVRPLPSSQLQLIEQTFAPERMR
jgi:hypothetical protein